jgi:SPP1 gp7 family putative phage head morphogenesis protein
MNQVIKEQLKLYRSLMTKKERARSRKRKPKRVKYPLAIERKYARMLRDLGDEVIEHAIKELSPFLMMYLKVDSVTDDLDTVMERVNDYMLYLYGEAYLSSGKLGEILTEISNELFGKNSIFLQEELKVMAGVPLHVPNEWWSTVQDLWARENYTLIKTLHQNYIGDLNRLIIESLQQGLDFETLVEKIEKLNSSVKGYKARRIARDQIGKLQTYISKEQHTAIGANEYIWITMFDERVRGNPSGIYPQYVPSHYMMEGLVMSWLDDSIYSIDGITWQKKEPDMVQVHVGMEIMCRCTSASIFANALIDIDRELGDNI